MAYEQGRKPPGNRGTVPQSFDWGIEYLISPTIFNPYENKVTSFLIIEGTIGAIVSPVRTGLDGSRGS
jgi:hypothetical protein